MRKPSESGSYREVDGGRFVKSTKESDLKYNTVDLNIDLDQQTDIISRNAYDLSLSPKNDPI